MKIYITSIVQLSLLLLIFSACKTQSKVIFVADNKAECKNGPAGLCYQIKEKPGDEWKMFQGDIAGFDYEEGYNYTLKVKPLIKSKDNQNKDLELVKVLSKEETKSFSYNADLLTKGTWTLLEMGPRGNPKPVIEETLVTIQFSDEGNKISGKGGCNNYFSDYEVNEEDIKFGMIGSTEMYCENPQGLMDQETAYFKLLQNVNMFEIDTANKRLTLYTSNEKVLIFSGE
jgi:heat shock protein HslJ